MDRHTSAFTLTGSVANVDIVGYQNIPNAAITITYNDGTSLILSWGSPSISCTRVVNGVATTLWTK